MNRTPKCWCDTSDIISFAPEYMKCRACETLISVYIPGSEISRVTVDECDFYGRNYWFAHTEEKLGLPNILVRSKKDLPERCLYWLRTALKYRLPPARVLELGSGHGGFVSLLRWAGFEATGLELSPWVVEFARRRFDVPMLLGPVEDQQIEPRSLDVIAMMDVLEHLPDPTATVRHCSNLLKPNGLLIIQTPRYPEGKSYQELVTRNDRFLEMLKPMDHVYLFSRHSIREFFTRLGYAHMQFEPAIFPHYDMFFAVSRAPLVPNTTTAIKAGLRLAPGRRLVQAFLAADRIVCMAGAERYQLVYRLLRRMERVTFRLLWKLTTSRPKGS
ncbi:class I SAM-dependent methyltransferase [Candidatus Methylomirabilis sp.]|uniref:class I SAM-dependent methyltransferase n=1 Tax=Candidatus Methylomirabilis sp. TaxID=2032687 RepID=UPI002A5EAA5B|nr:class I SAM-dependent methyltransferase [Candidatus Methylomirabilis sp.]